MGNLLGKIIILSGGGLGHSNYLDDILDGDVNDLGNNSNIDEELK